MVSIVMITYLGYQIKIDLRYECMANYKPKHAKENKTYNLTIFDCHGRKVWTDIWLTEEENGERIFPLLYVYEVKPAM